MRDFLHAVREVVAPKAEKAPLWVLSLERVDRKDAVYQTPPVEEMKTPRLTNQSIT